MNIRAVLSMENEVELPVTPIDMTTATTDDVVAQTDEVSTEIETLLETEESAENVTAAIESLMGYSLERRPLTVAIEGILASNGLESVFDHYFPQFGMESADVMSDSEMAVAIEGITSALRDAGDKAANRLSRVFGDMWAYEFAAHGKIAVEAKELLSTLQQLRGSKPTRDTVLQRNLPHLQCEGRADPKSIIEGFKRLVAVEERLKADVPKQYKDLVKRMLTLYKKTASLMDVGSELFRSFSRFFMWIGIIGATITFNPVGAAALYAAKAFIKGEVVPLMMSAVTAHLGPARSAGMKSIVTDLVKTYVEYLEGVLKSSLSKPMSGDRHFDMGYWVPSASQGSVHFPNMYFQLKEVGKRLEFNIDQPTPTLADMEAMLTAVIKNQTDNRGAWRTYKDLKAIVDNEVDTLQVNGVGYTESKGLRMGSRSLKLIVVNTYARPLVLMGKTHVSVSRMMVDYCRRGLSAYR